MTEEEIQEANRLGEEIYGKDEELEAAEKWAAEAYQRQHGKKPHAETIGKLCRDNADMISLEALEALKGYRALDELARICGELYEEMDAARNECDAVARWIQEYIDEACGSWAEAAYRGMLGDFKNRFSAAAAILPDRLHPIEDPEDPDGFMVSDTDGGAP